MIHRDIKCANVLLKDEVKQSSTRAITSKLSDFGSARGLLGGSEFFTGTADVSHRPSTDGRHEEIRYDLEFLTSHGLATFSTKHDTLCFGQYILKEVESESDDSLVAA